MERLLSLKNGTRGLFGLFFSLPFSAHWKVLGRGFSLLLDQETLSISALGFFGISFLSSMGVHQKSSRHSLPLPRTTAELSGRFRHCADGIATLLGRRDTCALLGFGRVYVHGFGIALLGGQKRLAGVGGYRRLISLAGSKQ